MSAIRPDISSHHPQVQCIGGKTLQDCAQPCEKMAEAVQAELAEVEEELQAVGRRRSERPLPGHRCEYLSPSATSWRAALQVEAEIEHLLARQQHLSDQRERLRQRLAAEARAPKADWTGAFEWDGRVEAALQNVFGLDDFRPLQREVR